MKWTIKDIIVICLFLAATELTSLGLKAVVFVLYSLYWEYGAAADWKAALSTVKGAAIVESSPVTFAIATGEIEKITGRFWSQGRMFAPALFKLNIITNGMKEEMSLNRRELIKLLDTRLNKWFIDYDTYSIEPGNGGMHIKYAPVGKYAFGSSSVLVLKILSYMVLPVFWLLSEYTWISFSQLLMPAISVLLVLVLWRKYKMVAVELDDQGITLEEQGGKKQFLHFADVLSVEKGLFRILVTTKAGQSLYFPAALQLLPELIEELAGLKKS